MTEESPPGSQRVEPEDIRPSETAVSEEADPRTQSEQSDLAKQREEVRLEKLRAEAHGLAQDIEERKKYANRLFWLIAVWLVGLFMALDLQGFGGLWSFSLSDKVLMTLITGTTANVIGIFIVVANYLFPKPK